MLIARESISEPLSIVSCSGADPTAKELILLFEQIASDEGWQPGNALRVNAAHSEYVGLFAGEQPIGGIQMVLPTVGASWWPSRSVWPENEPCGRMDIGHILIMGVRKEHRGRKELFWRMCAHVWSICTAHGLTEVWLEATPATLRVYRRIGFPLDVIGPCRPHWGEDCYLTKMTISAVHAAIKAKARSSAFYRQLMEYASELA